MKSEDLILEFILGIAASGIFKSSQSNHKNRKRRRRNMIDNGDICSKCNKPQLPKWRSEYENARACQNCGEVDERKVVVLKPEGVISNV